MLLLRGYKILLEEKQRIQASFVTLADFLRMGKIFYSYITGPRHRRKAKLAHKEGPILKGQRERTNMLDFFRKFPSIFREGRSIDYGQLKQGLLHH